MDWSYVMKSRMIQTPFDAAEVGANLDDYPSILHFFKCRETSGPSLACAKTGLIWTPYELDFDPAIGAVWPSKTYATYTNDGLVTNGTWATLPENKYICHMYVVRVQDMQSFHPTALTDDERLRVRCRIGPLDDAHKLEPSFNGHKYGSSCRGAIHLAITGTNGNRGWWVVDARSLDLSMIGQDIAVVSKLWRSGGDINRQITVYDSTGIQIGTLTSTQTDADIAPGDIMPSPQAGWSGGKFFGAIWMAFSNGYPSILPVAIKWMANAWINGDRRPYPGLVGVV